MKKKLCFAKFKNHAILNSILFVLIFLFSIVMPGFMMAIGIMCSLIPLGIAAFYVYSYFSYQKRVNDLTPSTGIIFNWKSSGYRNIWGCVTLKHEGVEYCSPNYFHTQAAEEMVGKEVSYVILDDTLLIYEILN